jgi:FG-GAP repeat
VPGTAEHDDAFGAALAKGDFNGDMRFDVAVGVPDEAVGGTTLAGAVNVLYGSPGGLTGAGGQLVTQHNPEPGDFFGASLAAGDFDGDGFFDLAVGAVSVFYAAGGPGGVVTPGPAFLQQGSGGLGGTAEAFDFFGAALE